MIYWCVPPCMQLSSRLLTEKDSAPIASFLPRFPGVAADGSTAPPSEDSSSDAPSLSSPKGNGDGSKSGNTITKRTPPAIAAAKTTPKTKKTPASVSPLLLPKMGAQQQAK